MNQGYSAITTDVQINSYIYSLTKNYYLFQNPKSQLCFGVEYTRSRQITAVERGGASRLDDHPGF